ncbi:MAG TPA: FAD-dependent oxidoreductase [Verrucomicrobiae bacterium]|nr:FAD-dependent oxidoreductase [Verrucomicrobiae bacterium]
MSKRVVIIGGGVIGLSTAYYCARRGFAVTVIERNGEQRDGTSFGNAGMVVPSHFVPLAAPGMVKLGLKWMWNPASPFYIKPRLDADLFKWGIKFWRAANAGHVRRAAPVLRDLSLASRACFEEIAALPGVDFGLVKKGLLMLCREPHTLDEEAKTAEQARALGIPAEVLDAKQTAALDPCIRMDIVGSVHFPLDCHLTPARFMAALQQHCEQLGVKFLWNSEVVDWKTGGTKSTFSGARLCEPQQRELPTDAAAGHRPALQSKAVRTLAVTISNAETIEADEFILCGGSWSPMLARKLGLNIPIQAGKGYSLTLAQPRQLPQICSILCEARVAVTPMSEALRVGGTMEISGLNLDVNPVRVQGIVNSFCRYFPEFRPQDFAGIQPWRGLRPCSPDGLPYLGRTKKFENLSLATGHAMMGLSLGPATGKLMAEILSGEKPAIDLSLLSPDRFG